MEPSSQGGYLFVVEPNHHKSFAHDGTPRATSDVDPKDHRLLFSGVVRQNHVRRQRWVTPPVGLNFIRGLFRQQFDVDGNVVVIVVPDMRLMRDERSIFNRHTQQIAFNCCDNLKEALIANEEKGENAIQLNEDFNVLAISPYKAEGDMLSVQLDKLNNRRLSSVTEAVAQGLVRQWSS